jgi:hypothetical protein
MVTEFGELEFEMHRVSRPQRQAVLRSLPEALLEQMHEQSGEDAEVDVSDFNDLDDLGDARPDDFSPDAVMSKEAAEKFEDIIVESLEHPSLATEPEIRELVQAMGDKEFYATGYLVLAYSGKASGVKRFRTDE